MPILVKAPPPPALIGRNVPFDKRSSMARKALEQKGLANAQLTNLWGGYGSQLPCDGCGQTICSDEIEYELEFRQGEKSVTLMFHFECWQSSHEDEDGHLGA
jgi:hypothetical protein